MLHKVTGKLNRNILHLRLTHSIFWEDILAEIHTKYQQDSKVMMEWVDKLPSHYEYLRDNIYDLQEEETVG